MFTREYGKSARTLVPTTLAGTCATLLVLASACSGIDQPGQDETLLDLNVPQAGSALEQAGDDAPTLDSDSDSDSDEPQAEPGLGQPGDDGATLDKAPLVEPAEPIIGTLEQAFGAPKLNDRQSPNFGGNLVAQSFSFLVGKDCSPGYVRSGTPTARWISDVGGFCAFEGWLNLTNTSDCRALILARTAGGGFGGTCHSEVFEELKPITFTFSAVNTNSAQQNTTNQTLALTAGQMITVGTCGVAGSSFNGDTVLRLLDASGNEVAVSDDACNGFGSRFVFTATSAANFEVQAGCFGNSACRGAVVIQ